MTTDSFKCSDPDAGLLPLGNELTSIIILCCNQLEYTRLCLESVFLHTGTPYELVLVDNGSTDDTPAYLEEIRRRPGPIRVEVIRNETNRGFPAGCNQALAHARGRYLLFLNNDTIATEGWLEGLIAWAHPRKPGVGMVGAVSNFTAPPQQVPVDYTDSPGMEVFAAKRRQEFAHQGLKVDRLTGFCLLVCREVLERIGGFDERYGLGFFDDDDLSERVREAGFGLVVALNVFVHHFGNRTFLGLGVDCWRQLADNLEVFRTKWGPERTAHYRLPDPGPRPKEFPGTPAKVQALTERNAPPPEETSTISRPRISLTMIVRNEEANLPACLQSVAGLVDEIIIVDTGSTDRTKEVATQWGAKVFDFPWCDSFAAARNESLHHATGQWIFWLDADDRLDDENRERLRQLFASLKDDHSAFVMKCLCLGDPAQGGTTVVDHIRLFRNHPTLRWEGRVHEQILAAVRRLGGEVHWSDVVIHHSGYQDPALRGRKLERDLRLLRLEDRDQPDNPFTLFNLGSVYVELNRPAEALPLLRRSLALSHPKDSIVRKLYALIMQCHRQLGQPAEALAACRAGKTHCPDDIELLFVEGQLLADLRDAAAAIACFERILQLPPAGYFASVDPALRGHKARYHLADLYHQQGRLAEAETQWQAAVAEHPSFWPALLRLGELYVEQGRWDHLEQTIQKMEALVPNAVDPPVLRARACLAQKNYAAARKILEEAVTRFPQALSPRQLLTHVLLQEGRDWSAAEKALRAVLALNPHHAEARHNLAILLQQRVQA